jgi:hypothetical protein
MSWFVIKDFIGSVGFPIFLVLVIGWGVIRGGIWLGKFCVLPITRKVLEFFDTLIVAVRDAHSILKVLSDDLREMRDDLNVMRDDVTVLRDAHESKDM